MRATGSHDLHLDVDGAGADALLGGRGGAGPAGGPADAALAGGQLRGGLRRRGPVRGGRRGGAPAAPASLQRPAGGAGPDRPGRRARSRRPGWWWWRRPAGSTRPRASRRPTAGCGGRSCWPARPRWRWPRRCWRRPAPRRPGAGTPLERLYRDARCGSLQPATSDVCADWLGVAALGRRPGPRRGRGAAVVSARSTRDRAIAPARRRYCPAGRCGTASSPSTTRARPGLAERIFANSGVRTRHGVVNPLVEDVSGWATGQRMERYLVEALPLGKDAVSRRARGRRRRSPARSGLFVGLLLHRLRDARRWTSCWPGTWACRPACSGCSSGTWAATRRCPGWARSADLRGPRAGPRCCSALELTSLHIQPAVRGAAPADRRARAVLGRGGAPVL